MVPNHVAQHSSLHRPLRCTRPPLPLLVARAALAALAAAVCLLATGCANTPNEGDGSFGMTTRALIAQQIRNPQAPQRNAALTPATDGRTMREAMDRHVGSFKEPPTTTVVNIGVGGGGGR